MQPETNDHVVDRNKAVISVVELKRLLVELKDKRANTCIRYRMIGEMWAEKFCKIIYVTEKGVVLNEEDTGKISVIQDLSQIMQFEIDTPFQGFQPYFHYDVNGFISDIVGVG